MLLSQDNRIKLRFKGISGMSDSKETSVILLTDVFEYRQLSVLCDSRYIFMFQQRFENKEWYYSMIPELLIETLKSHDILNMEMTINGIRKGEYVVSFTDKELDKSSNIRACDAALLSFCCKVPLYMDEQLFRTQTTPYIEGSPTITIPCNVMTSSMLEKALDDAVKVENYELASRIKTELKKREDIK